MPGTARTTPEAQHPTHALGHASVVAHGHGTTPDRPTTRNRTVLAWPAWLRVAAVSPLLVLLWLAVWWANEGVSLW